ELTPRLRSRRDLLAHRGRHGEHAGISARDERDFRALGGMAKRRLRPRRLLAIVRGMPRLVFPDRNAVEIGTVAVKRLGDGERIVGLRRQVALVARADADDGKPAAHARSSQPGTRTMAK